MLALGERFSRASLGCCMKLSFVLNRFIMFPLPVSSTLCELELDDRSIK